MDNPNTIPEDQEFDLDALGEAVQEEDGEGLNTFVLTLVRKTKTDPISLQLDGPGIPMGGIDVPSNVYTWLKSHGYVPGYWFARSARERPLRVMLLKALRINERMNLSDADLEDCEIWWNAIRDKTGQKTGLELKITVI